MYREVSRKMCRQVLRVVRAERHPSAGSFQHRKLTKTATQKPGARNIEKVLKEAPSVLFGEEYHKRKKIEEYLLKWGGMPALLKMEEEERWKWLRDYQYTYLERDLSDLARIEYLEPFKKFQRLTAMRSGKLLNYSELARDAGVSVETARRYMEYLRISYQTILLQPYYENITSSTVKTPKIYFLDVGVMRSVSGFKDVVTGEIYETFIVSEIYKWIKTADHEAEMYFYRSRSGMEVDLLILIEGRILGIEVKYRERLSSRDFRSLKEVGERLGKRWMGGIILYPGNEIKKLGEPSLWAVPSWYLFT